MELFENFQCTDIQKQGETEFWQVLLSVLFNLGNVVQFAHGTKVWCKL